MEKPSGANAGGKEGSVNDQATSIMEDPFKQVMDIAVLTDIIYHRNHMEAYGCGKEFANAVKEECNRSDSAPHDRAARQACAKATAKLRQCMEADPVHFRAYVRAMDQGLNEDERRAVAGEPPLPAWDDADCRFRWWTGLKRT